MRIDHLAIHVRDLDGAAKFFKEYFGAQVDETYHNPKTGLRSNFLKLDELRDHDTARPQGAA